MPILKYSLFAFLLLFAFDTRSQEIQWMTWEEAAKANETQPRKLFVDVYTDWCGWCRKMDATTFKDPMVVKELNSKFYPVKLNAEQKETILWNKQEFKWFASGRDGLHQLAYELLDGQMSYPTYVILDEEFSRILISPGYMESPMLLKELQFAAEEHYKTTKWDVFKAKS